jgi:glycine cleavage system aminomethyltransferase T
VATVSVGVVDFAEDVTAFELFDPDPVVAARLLSRAAAAPACGPRTRAELADLARRQPAVADLADRLLVGRSATTSHLTGGVRLGSLARLVRHPIRRTALADEHLRLGGRMELVDDWLDVAHYGDVEAERRALTDAVGVRDTGRCGLFDIEGPDGAALLNGLLADAELPAVGCVQRIAGDGGRPAVVVARPAERHWQLRVDAVDARAVEGRLLTLVHLEHRDWQVFLTPVGESLAGIALVGPSASAVLADLGYGPDDDGTVQALDEQLGVPGWIWRWAGLRGPVVELRAPAGRIVPLWRDVLGWAADHGGVAVGSEAAEGAL